MKAGVMMDEGWGGAVCLAGRGLWGAPWLSGAGASWLGWAGLGWAGESIASPRLATLQERDISVLGDALPCCTHSNNVSLGSAGVGHGPGRCPLLRAAPSEPASIPEGKS